MKRARKRRGTTGAMCLVFAAMTLAWGQCAWPADAGLDVSQYAHTAWKVRDGFVKGAITAITQTPDGYLWLGTEYGLYRFDGVRAVPWQPPAGQQLPDNSIRSLLVARDGTLWIATWKGLASWTDGKLTLYREFAGQTLGKLFQDRDGTVWFGAYQPGRLCALQGARIECYGAGSFGNGVFSLSQDHYGDLWALASTGVWRWKPGSPKQYVLPQGAVEATDAIEDDSGRLLLATNAGLKQLVAGRMQDYALPNMRGQLRPLHFLRSSDGSLWIGSKQGLFHVHQGRTDVFQVVDGLSGDTAGGIFEDREGNIWVRTPGGLDRFRQFAVPGISRGQGLSSNDAYSIQATQDGAIWMATTSGLNRWEHGRVTVYGRRYRPRETGRKDDQEAGAGRGTTEVTNSGLAGNPTSLGLDDEGRLWVATGGGGAFRLEAGRFTRVPGFPAGNIWSMVGDGHARMWISGNAGLSFLTPRDAVRSIPWSELAHTGYGAEALLPEASQGGVWLGFYGGGVAYLKDGKAVRSYGASEGLGNGRVSQLRFGSRMPGALWAATEGGLSRIKDGHVETLSSKNGLPCDKVHWSMEDDDRAMWVYMPCGLARIERSEWYAWIDDPRHFIKATIFDNSDGVASVGLYGGYGPHMTKAPDGKIWFLTHEGASVIDPRHLPHNDVAPPVKIEQIIADGKTYDAASGLRLPPLVHDLTIDYTALSLAVPEKVRFRFKLEGQDKDWREAVNNRHVEYSNLAPKHYRFRVMASNNSGVWNEEGALLDFSIAPAYYQTMWFRALCVAAFLALLWAVYQYRMHRIQREFNAGLEGRVNERLRIARELHDTLLQSFQGLVLRFQTASNLLPASPEEAKEKLDNAIEIAAQAVTEGRSAVQGLRASATLKNELAAAVDTLGKELAGNGTNGDAPAFGVTVEGEPQDLHPILRDELYRIAGEAMRNAFRHAQAERIEVEIHYDASELRVRIRDNGKGIAQQIIENEGRRGHWGLHGMRERAKIIGGNLEVWSSAEAGTEVELTIPARVAYAAAKEGRSWFSGKGTVASDD